MKFIIFLLSTISAFAQEPFAFKENIPLLNEGGTWVSEWYEFTVPKNLTNMQIVALGSRETLIQVGDLIDPTGFAYVSSTGGKSKKIISYANPIIENVKSPNRSEAVALGTASLIVPNSPKLESPKPGIWKIRTLSPLKPKEEKVNIFVYGNKPNPNPSLDAKVWVAPESYWAQKEITLKILDGTKAIYADLGINLNILNIDYLSKTFDHPIVLPKELSQLAWENNDPSVLNIYLMPTMEFQNKPINGLACLGGPSNIKIQHSCFVSLYANTEADTIAMEEKSRILAHEIGHYLGLFHTRDNGYYLIGHMVDPLDDTPTVVTGKNMMDPGVHNNNPKFSEQQIQMLHNSPALK